MARRGIIVIFSLLAAAVVLSTLALAAIFFFVGREPGLPSNAVLTMDIGGELAEVAPNDVVTYLSGSRAPTLATVVGNLRKAKVDPRVSAVFLKLTGLSTPYWAKVQELRDAVIDFKASGKPIYAYLEYAGDKDYYLATAASKVLLMPSSPVDLNGVATFEVFLRGALDKAGVYPDLHHIGQYKTASNTFTEKTFTAAHKEMDESMNRDLFTQIVAGVAEGRGKAEADVRTLVDQGPFLPEAALSAGLVDVVAYEDQARQQLRDAHPEADRREIKGEEYARVSLKSLGLNRGPRIAVVYAAGTIVSGKSGYDPLNGATMGADSIVEAIREASRDSRVRAIVMRIDSPGGSAAASDAIWRAMVVAREEHPDRPMVASMSDLAASGGYYMAMAAHSIVAEPSTLTGSIGIFGGKFVTGGLYEKLGANIESTSIGANAEMNSPARPYNASEQKKVEEQLRTFYNDFIRKVAQSRGTTPEKIDQIAQGRVWTGQQAKMNGLVDELGGLPRAVAIAKERAQIPADSDVELVSYPAAKTFYQLLSEQMSGGSEAAGRAWMAASLTDAEKDLLRAVRGPAAFFRRGEVLALMPAVYLR